MDAGRDVEQPRQAHLDLRLAQGRQQRHYGSGLGQGIVQGAAAEGLNRCSLRQFCAQQGESLLVKGDPSGHRVPSKNE